MGLWSIHLQQAWSKCSPKKAGNWSSHTKFMTKRQWQIIIHPCMSSRKLVRILSMVYYESKINYKQWIFRWMLICTDQSKQRTRDEHKISVSCTTKYFLMLMDLKKDTFASPIVSTASQDTIMKGVARSLHITNN